MENEKRLIDANALKYTRVRIFHGMNEDGTVIVGGANAVVMSSAIKDAPTVDAVEVVRCKDCKYCEFCYPEKQIGKEPTPAWICKMHKAYRRPNDFCSFGERKEDG